MTDKISYKIAFTDVPPIMVAEKLSLFDPDGTLKQRCKPIAKLLSGQYVEFNRRFWETYNARMPAERRVTGELLEKMIESAGSFIDDKYGDPTGQKWATTSCFNAWQAHMADVDIGTVIACIGSANELAITKIFEAHGDDVALTAKLTKTTMLMAAFEADILHCYKQRLQEYIRRQERIDLASQFETTVAHDMLGASAGSDSTAESAA